MTLRFWSRSSASHFAVPVSRLVGRRHQGPPCSIHGGLDGRKLFGRQVLGPALRLPGTVYWLAIPGKSRDPSSISTRGKARVSTARHGRWNVCSGRIRKPGGRGDRVWRNRIPGGCPSDIEHRAVDSPLSSGRNLRTDAHAPEDAHDRVDSSWPKAISSRGFN